MEAPRQPDPEPRPSANRPSRTLGPRLAALAGAGCLVLFVAMPVAFSDGFQPWKGAELTYQHPFSVTTAIDPTGSGLLLNTIVGHNDGKNNLYGLTSTVMTDTFSFDNPMPQRGPDLVQDACCAPRQSLVISGTGGGFPVTGSDGVAALTPYWIQYSPTGTNVKISRVDPLRTDTFSTSHHMTKTRQVVVTHSTATDTLWVYDAPMGIDPTFSFVPVEIPADSPQKGLHWDGVLRGEALWLLAPFAGTMWLHEVNLSAAVVDSSTPLGKSTNDVARGFYYADLTVCADGKRLAGVFPDPVNDSLTVFMSDVGASKHVSDVISYPPAPDAQGVVCNDDVLILFGADGAGAGALELWVNFGNLPVQSLVFTDTLRNVDAASVFETHHPITITRTIPVVEIDFDSAPRGVVREGTVRHGWLHVPMFFDTFESGDTSFWTGSRP